MIMKKLLATLAFVGLVGGHTMAQTAPNTTTSKIMDFIKPEIKGAFSYTGGINQPSNPYLPDSGLLAMQDLTVALGSGYTSPDSNFSVLAKA